MTKQEYALSLRQRTDVHHNCAQSVLIPFARELGLNEKMAFQLGAHFGGGMRVGSTCGALTGGLMVLGMLGYPQEQAEDLISRFQTKHGTLNCADLLRPVQEGKVEKGPLCNGLVLEITQYLENLLEKDNKKV